MAARDLPMVLNFVVRLVVRAHCGGTGSNPVSSKLLIDSLAQALVKDINDFSAIYKNSINEARIRETSKLTRPFDLRIPGFSFIDNAYVDKGDAEVQVPASHGKANKVTIKSSRFEVTSHSGAEAKFCVSPKNNKKFLPGTTYTLDVVFENLGQCRNATNRQGVAELYPLYTLKCETNGNWSVVNGNQLIEPQVNETKKMSFPVGQCSGDFFRSRSKGLTDHSAIELKCKAIEAGVNELVSQLKVPKPEFFEAY